MMRSMGTLNTPGQTSGSSGVIGLGRLDRGFRGVAAVVVVSLLVGACSASTSATAPLVLAASGTPVAATVMPTTASTPTVMASTASPAQIPAASLDATAVPTTLDPCQIVPASEASALAGTTYAAGVESVTSGNGKICAYGGQTLNVFEAIVGQAPDVATAKAGKAEAEAAIAAQASGIKFIELPGFADGAAYVIGSMTVSGQTFNGSAFYALKGTVFFGFSDIALGHATPTLAAMEAEAQTILGRLP